MTRKSPTNLAESVRQRLLNLARHKGEDFQVTLNNYFLERFLYRLSRSAIHYLATQFSFDGVELTGAIRRTFARRNTPLPEEVPVGLTEEYWKQAGRDAQLRAFVRRARMDVASQSVSGIAPTLRTFLLPPWEALRDNEPFARHWPASGPWCKAQGGTGFRLIVRYMNSVLT